MADDFIQIAPQSTGPAIDQQSLTNASALKVYRQTTTLGDGNDIAAVQTVRPGSSPPVASDGAAVFVRRPDSDGSTGTDFSTNAPAWPTVGNNFSGSGPYAGWFLLATVPVNQSRLMVTIDNLSSEPVLCLRDDGTSSGIPPANPTAFLLNAKVSVGPEGGHYSSSTFRGRIQVFGASASQFVAISTD